jgi:integrase
MSTAVVLDAAGRRRWPATLPGHHAGRVPRSKGQRYLADPSTVEEIVAVMRQTREDRHGFRVRALIVVLWRAGLRVGEALGLTEPDLDERRGSLLVRIGNGGRRRVIGMDAWGWEQLRPWLAARADLAVGALFCVIDGPTRGRAWSGAAVPARAPPTCCSGRCAPWLRAASAPPRPRSRARPRGHCPEHHPTTAWPRQPGWVRRRSICRASTPTRSSSPRTPGADR